MEIILQKSCKSLTGHLDSYSGYSIRKQHGGFFGKRNSKGNVPADGHWKFIVTCAQISGGLHIADINVDWREVYAALWEARKTAKWSDIVDSKGCPVVYHAADILLLKEKIGL